MFGDDERLRLGQIEHLTGAMIDARFRIEARAARRARRWVMIDDLVGISDLSQGLAFVTLLPARFLARTFAQARHPRRLLQSIARWRLAAVRTVQTKPAFKFGDMRFQSRDLGRLRRDQRNQLFPRWLGRRIRIHRILESNPDSDVQKNLRAQLCQTAYPTWAETCVVVQAADRSGDEGIIVSHCESMWAKFFPDVNPTMSRSLCGQKTSVQDVQKRTGVDHSPDAPMSYPDSASRRTSTGKALPPLFHKGQLRMRVSRDREHGFHCIVSKYFAGSWAPACNPSRRAQAPAEPRNGAVPSPDSALVSAGGEIKWLNGISVLASFEGEFSNNTQSYGGKGTLRYVW